MAFKLLNEAEQSLLSEEQLQQYQKDLSVYKQRVEFVNKLEQLEQVSVEPFTPNLSPVFLISKIEFRSYPKSEKVEPLLTHVSKHPVEQVRKVKKPENSQPKLPIMMNLKFKGKVIKTLNKEDHFTNPRNLPYVSIQIAKTGSFKVPDKKNSVLLNQHGTMPVWSREPYEESKPVSPNLPQIIISPTVDASFIRPQQENVKVPVVPVVSEELPKYTKTMIKDLGYAPNLPKIALCPKAEALFTKPQQEIVKVPLVPAATKELPDFNKTKVEDINFTPNLPKTVLCPKTDTFFYKPQQENVKVPVVPVEIDEIPVFSKPKMEIVDFPKIKHNGGKAKQLISYAKPAQLEIKTGSDFNPNRDVIVRTYVKPKTMDIDMPRTDSVLPSVVINNFEKPDVEIKATANNISSTPEIAIKHYVKPEITLFPQPTTDITYIGKVSFNKKLLQKFDGFKISIRKSNLPKLPELREELKQYL